VKKAGIIIIVVGIGLLVLSAFSLSTEESNHNPAKAGQLENTHQNFNWYPLIGIAVLGVGALVLERSS